jgi:hypothetical protein
MLQLCINWRPTRASLLECRAHSLVALTFVAALDDVSVLTANLIFSGLTLIYFEKRCRRINGIWLSDRMDSCFLFNLHLGSSEMCSVRISFRRYERLYGFGFPRCEAKVWFSAVDRIVLTDAIRTGLDTL